MSDILPGDQPAVFAAECIVQSAYETIMLENEYKNSRSEALICASIGSVALAGGLALANLHPNNLTGLTETVGWTYATSGAVFMMFGAASAVKAGMNKFRLRHRD